MEREPMEMPTKFGLIVFHRENRGRIAAEKLAIVLRTAGIMVAFMEDRENYAGTIKAENLAYLNFILLSENTYAIFPKHLSEKTKICYYSEKDNLFEILLQKLDQAEADELRKIWSILETYDLFSYLDNTNINIMMGSVPKNIFMDKLSDFDNAISELDADVFSTTHVGFAKLYLKHFHNKICTYLNFLPDYLLIDEIREMINKKEWHNHLSLTYLWVKELEMSPMDKIYALPYYLAISKIKMNPFIKNEFISNFKRYLKLNRKAYEADKLSEEYFRKLLPSMEVRYFFNFLILTRYKFDKDGLDQEVIPKFERYIKIYQTDLEHDLENFTPVELVYFAKISGNILHSYFRRNHNESYKYEKKKEYPFYDILREKIKQYHLKNYEDGLKRGVAFGGFGFQDWNN